MSASAHLANLQVRLFARAESVPLSGIGVGCSAATLLIAVFDALVAPLLALSVFYLLPVLAAAFRDPRLGAVWAVLTATAGCVVDLLQNRDVYGSTLVPVANAMSRLVVLVVVVLLVAALRQDRQRMAAMAARDQLTGLPNLRSFYDAVESARRSQVRTGLPLTLAYLDLDGFKSVNDDLGHAAGDRVLRHIGALLAASVREVDTVARLGGDEFAILMPHTAEAEARTALERVHGRLTQPPSAAPSARGGAPVPVQVSIGAVTFPQPLETVAAMISEADHVMYEVKRNGKNQVLVALHQASRS